MRYQQSQSETQPQQPVTESVLVCALYGDSHDLLYNIYTDHHLVSHCSESGDCSDDQEDCVLQNQSITSCAPKVLGLFDVLNFSHLTGCMYGLNCMVGQLNYQNKNFECASNSVRAQSCCRCLSVSPSVRVSNAWIVTKRNNSQSVYQRHVR